MKPKINMYVISDNHLKHWNINRLCKRGFKSLAHMDGVQKTRWNAIVRPIDLVIIPGDLVFTKGESAKVARAIKSLNGRKILIMGNHDRKTYSWYLTHGIDFVCHTFSWKYNKKNILFVHKPQDALKENLANYDYVIHGHQHNSTPFIQRKNRCVFVNVSVENINYTPLNLITLLSRLSQGYYSKRKKNV